MSDFSAIAISADLEGDFCGPCGACRQFMCEFNPDLDILLVRVADLKVSVNWTQSYEFVNYNYNASVAVG
jgi:cytidine deaminase